MSVFETIEAIKNNQRNNQFQNQQFAFVRSSDKSINIVEVRKKTSNTMEYSEQKETQPNSPQMKTFQSVQKLLATAGIRSTLAMQLYPFNGRILMGSFILGATICCIFQTLPKHLPNTYNLFIYSLRPL